MVGYLIRDSYIRQDNEQNYLLNRIQQFHNQPLNEEKNCNSISGLDTKDYIELRILGIGSSSIVYLIYHIEQRKLFAIKRSNAGNDKNGTVERELNNYQTLSHPLLPKFYGTTKNNDLIIEYINGLPLSDIENKEKGQKQMTLTFDDKINIIIELMITVQYFQEKGFVYRDLKPSNVIITNSHNAIIIDFDRMVKPSEFSNNEPHTISLSSKYVAPEVNEGIIEPKNDIYSLGEMINFIMNETDPTNDNSKKTFLDDIYRKSTDKDVRKRPSIFELICKFCSAFLDQILNSNVRLLKDVQYIIGMIYYLGEYITRDINQSIHYLSLAANQNHQDAQFQLGMIYYEGKYITRDINQSIHYLSLAANQNHQDAQFALGMIYYEGEYITRDINQFIIYHSLQIKIINMHKLLLESFI